MRDQPRKAIQSKVGQSHSHDEVANNDEAEQDENDSKISEEMIEVCKTTSDSSHSETETTGSGTIEKDTERWTTYNGKLPHLASTIGECQELLSAAGKTDAPNPKHLLGDLVDVVERINVQSSLLLEMAISEITKLDISTEKTISVIPPIIFPWTMIQQKRIKYRLMQIVIAEQGPFQLKLTRYPRNPEIKDENKTMYFFTGVVLAISIPMLP